MSEPRFSRSNHGKGHSYLLNGRRIAGVTTVIGVIDKPALVEWAAKTTAEYAVANWDRLAGMSSIARFEELKEARWKKNKEATVSGKRIHSLAERIAKGESIEKIPPELRGPVQAYADLLDEWGFDVVELELPVANLSYLYGGTADAILTSERTGPILVDIKTGRRAYSEVALQLAAYRYTDIYLHEVEQIGPRGGRRPSLWEERPMPVVNGCAAIHIARETEESPAKAELLPVQAGQAEFETFLHCLELFESWIKRTDSKNYRSDPAFNPPVGEPIYPEQANEILEELQ